MDQIMLLLDAFVNTLFVIILFYIVLALAKADRKFIKDHLMKDIEVMKRDKVFRKGLGILAFSLIFSVVGTMLSFFHITDVILVNGSQLISNTFSIIFFIYILSAVRSTLH